MIEHENEDKADATLTRRTVVFGNVRAIATIAAGVVGSQFMGVSSAQAHDRWSGGSSGGWLSWLFNWLKNLGHGGHGGTPCFMRGTRILTVEGECRIEDLAVGQLLPTMFGGPRAIEWIGSWSHVRQTPTSSWRRYQRPVRIAQSALGPNVPHADLYVTQGHAIYIDGVLVPAGALVNGKSISIDSTAEFNALKFFHVKLSSHDVIYAEGAPCETLLNTAGIAAEMSEAVPGVALASEKTAHCAPALCNGMIAKIGSRLQSIFVGWLKPRKIDVIRSRLAQQAAALT